MANIRDEMAKLEAYGTSEGVKKAWDTRGRGRKADPHASVLKKHGFQEIESGDQEKKLGQRTYKRGDKDEFVLTGPGGWRHDVGSDVARGHGSDSRSLDKHLASAPKERSKGEQAARDKENAMDSIHYMARNYMTGDEEETRIEDPQYYEHIKDPKARKELQDLAEDGQYNEAIHHYVDTMMKQHGISHDELIKDAGRWAKQWANEDDWGEDAADERKAVHSDIKNFYKVRKEGKYFI